MPPQRLTECHQPGEGNAQAVIARADEARCRATDDGRNSVRIADKVTLIADETYRHNRVS